MQFVPQRELREQWLPSAPVISGTVVVYTPPEEPLLVALDLLDGHRLWDQPKDDWTYLAGVFDQKVVLVGASEVAALDLPTGKTLWTASLDEAHPSGRGLAVQQHFYLPLSTGELRILDLNTGKTVSQTDVPANQPPLGNLAMHQGKLVSLSPQGLTGFGQRDAVHAEIARRKQSNPEDPWALLREAEILLLTRDASAALERLRRIPSTELPADERERHRDHLVQALAAVIKPAPQQHPRELEQLRDLARTSHEQRLASELLADARIADGQFLEAFEILWSLRSIAAEAGIPRVDDPRVSLSRDVWLRGRLRDLWSQTKDGDRNALDQALARVVGEASESERPQVAMLLEFHPAGAALGQSLLESRIAAEDFGTAELELLKQTQSTDRSLAARATARLARLLEDIRQPADAAVYYALLEQQFADVPVEGDRTGGQVVQQRRDAGTLPVPAPVRTPTWDERALQLVQGPVQYLPPTQDIPFSSTLPYFQNRTAEIHHQEQRVAFEHLDSSQYDWLAPLRSSLRFQGESHAATQMLGHELVLINRDVLQVLSPLEKRVLWSRPLDAGGEGGPFWRHANRPPLPPMTVARSGDDEQRWLLQKASFTGRLAVAEPGYLCVYGRRSIRVLDPRTGAWLWSRDGIPQFAQVVGTRDLVFIIPQETDKAEAFRAEDGQPVTIPSLDRLLRNTLQTHEDALLLLEPAAALPFFSFGPGKSVLRLMQPESGKDRWRIEVPATALLAPLSPEELLLVESGGKVSRLQVATGTRIPLEPLREADRKLRRTESYAIADDTHIFLVMNTPENSGFQHYGESLPSIRVNGVLCAWKRSDGTFAWRQEVQNQNLVIDRFRSVPVLLFLSRSWNPRGNLNYGTLSLLALHKQSGKILYKSTIPSMYSGFHSLDVNLADPSLELKSYNLRMRLIPSDDPVAQGPVPAVPAPEKP